MSDVAVTFKRKRLSSLGEASCELCLHALHRPHPHLPPPRDRRMATPPRATRLESIAPTQAGATQAPCLLPPPAWQQRQQPQQAAWGLPKEHKEFFEQVDAEHLLETTSRQTTPAGSRAASPHGAGMPGPCTALQPDLAAIITQQLGQPAAHALQRGHPAALPACAGERRRGVLAAGCRWLPGPRVHTPAAS